MSEKIEIKLEDGKYTYVLEPDRGMQYALRYGQPWRDLCGDNLIYWMGVRIVELERQVAELRKDAQKAINDAYYEGFFARATHNDTQVNNEDEEFAKSTAKRDIAALAQAKKAAKLKENYNG